MRYALLVLVMALAGCKDILTVTQPVIAGDPGVVYQTTNANVSVDILNNTTQIGDILAGTTIIYSGVQPKEIKNIGFFCDGVLLYNTTERRYTQTGARTEWIYFRPRDSRYQVESYSVYVQCGYRDKQKWDISFLSQVYY